MSEANFTLFPPPKDSGNRRGTPSTHPGPLTLGPQQEGRCWWWLLRKDLAKDARRFVNVSLNPGPVIRGRPLALCYTRLMRSKCNLTRIVKLVLPSAVTILPNFNRTKSGQSVG